MDEGIVFRATIDSMRYSKTTNTWKITLEVAEVDSEHVRKIENLECHYEVAIVGINV